MVCGLAVAQPNTFEKIYGAGGYDGFADFIETTNNCYLILGNTENYGAQSSDILLFKIDKYGTPIWKKLIGNNGVENAKQIIKLNNSYGILAQTNSNATADYNIIYYNIDTLGNIRYSKIIDSGSWDYAEAISLNPTDSTLLISGSYDNDTTGIKSPSLHIINTDGTVIQSKYFANNYNWYLSGLIKGNTNKYYATGTTYQTDTLGNIALATITVLTNDINVSLSEFVDTNKQTGSCISRFEDGSLALGATFEINDTITCLKVNKVDTNGVVIWHYEGFVNVCVTGNNAVNSIVILGDNSCAFVGSIKSLNTPCTNIGNGGDEVLLFYSDANGNYSFNKSYGGIGKDFAKKAIKTKDGALLLVGETNSFGNGLNDIYLIKSDTIHNTLNPTTQVVDNLLSQKEIVKSNNSIQVFNHLICINNLATINTSYKIFDTQGRLIKFGLLAQSNNLIEIENLINGVYIFKLESINESSYLKFTKQ